jgi:Protein of unknown function (DUF4233)
VTARALGTAVLTLELLVVFFGALVAQFGGSTAHHLSTAYIWIGFGMVLLTYVVAIGGLGQGRGGCFSWIGQIATLAYSFYIGGFMPYLAAIFVVLWYFTIKILGRVLQAKNEGSDQG